MPQSRRVLFFLVGALIGGIIAGFILLNRAQTRGPRCTAAIDSLPLWQGKLLYACELKPVEPNSPGERVRILIDPGTGKTVRLVEALVKDPSKESYYVIRRQAMFPDRIRVQWCPGVDDISKRVVMQSCQCSSLGMSSEHSSASFEVLQIHINAPDPYPIAKRWLSEHPDCVERVCPVFW